MIQNTLAPQRAIGVRVATPGIGLADVVHTAFVRSAIEIALAHDDDRLAAAVEALKTGWAVDIRETLRRLRFADAINADVARRTIEIGETHLRRDALLVHTHLARIAVGVVYTLDDRRTEVV